MQPSGAPAVEPTQTDPLATALLAGDAAVFADVVRAWSPALLRVARAHVSTDASAQEVVQEAWLAVVRGLPGFQGRSMLRTWAFRILVNTAKARGVRESRVTPVADVSGDEPGATVDPSRFRGSGDPWHRHWTPTGTPQSWDGDPVQGALRGEVRALLDDALSGLPVRQRTVVVLRDVEGLSAGEACAVLDLSPENQRVLLHRGRARLRAALETYYREVP